MGEVTLEDRVIARLDRFEIKVEEKLDKVGQAMLEIARVEERQTQHSKETAALWKKYDSLAEKFAVLQNSNVANTIKIGFGERVWWAVALLLLGGAATFFGLK